MKTLPQGVILIERKILDEEDGICLASVAGVFGVIFLYFLIDIIVQSYTLSRAMSVTLWCTIRCPNKINMLIVTISVQCSYFSILTILFRLFQFLLVLNYITGMFYLCEQGWISQRVRTSLISS